MSVFKCKMCGGSLEIGENESVATCEYCGTQQTLPKLDDERKANLYDRANHFRRNNDFDKAAGIYEQILNEDLTDAEAYWSLVLCRYGIEYVEDPATHKRVPTVNRAQFTSIFDDDNYKSALAYAADTLQRSVYESEAKAINEIQKGILAISQKEEPFDVFICYKETDANGRRTPDSVLANDLYHQLTQEGFKVFFARITLEDKLGTAYEPYIFAALNSAKVMVVLGTKPEYFNAVWVKNEWSRYLALVKKSGGKKILIPAYKDMDPYDLPEEFSHLQAQDMSKLGFMQDLIRGIKKIVSADAPQPVKETVVVNTAANANIAPLLKRAFMFLEDGEWSKADDFCEQVLNQDPENAQAYLGKLMAELKVRQKEKLADCEIPFDSSRNCEKAIRFGDEKLISDLRGYIAHINERNEKARELFENNRLTTIYNIACGLLNEAKTEEDFKEAGDVFVKIPGFKDADTLAEQCRKKAEICRFDEIYASARKQMENDTEKAYLAASKAFRTIHGWKDADALAEECREKASICQKNDLYNEAMLLGESCDSDSVLKAIEQLKRITGWKDADAQAERFTARLDEVKQIEAQRFEQYRKDRYNTKYSALLNSKSGKEEKLNEINKDLTATEKSKKPFFVMILGIIFINLISIVMILDNNYTRYTYFGIKISNQTWDLIKYLIIALSIIGFIVMLLGVSLIKKRNRRVLQLKIQQSQLTEKLNEIANIPTYEVFCQTEDTIKNNGK